MFLLTVILARAYLFLAPRTVSCFAGAAGDFMLRFYSDMCSQGGGGPRVSSEEVVKGCRADAEDPAVATKSGELLPIDSFGAFALYGGAARVFGLA